MPERVRLRLLLSSEVEHPTGQTGELLAAMEELEPADVAACLQEFEVEQIQAIFARLAPDRAGEVLVATETEFQRELVSCTSVAQLERIVETLQPDDAADVYQLLPQRHRIGILQSIDKDLAADIRMLAAYEEETVGAIMTPRFVAVEGQTPVADAIEAVRQAEELEADDVYVVDEEQRLAGVVSIPELLQAEQDVAVREVAEAHALSVNATADQEEAVRLAATYGLGMVPVVDDGGRLVGVVTDDDLDIVQEEEASEDIYRLAGTNARHPTKLPVSRRIVNRLPTMLATIAVGLITSQILALLNVPRGDGDEQTAIRYVLIVIALAGNVGTIANAIVVRGLATQEIEHGRLMQPFGGEMLVALGLGSICAGLTWLGVGLLESDFMLLPSVVALALFCAVLFSAVAGFLIPLGCDKIKIDPALAGPLVIAFNDLAGTALYVGIVLALLPSS